MRDIAAFFLGLQEAQHMKKPGIDLCECNLCESCVAVCLSVFFINDAGMIEIVEMDVYPEVEINEAIKYCPEDCIFWEDE